MDIVKADPRIEVPAMPDLEIRADGNANFYHLTDGKQWLAVVQLNGTFLTGMQEAIMEKIANALKSAG
jgi:hypothetical protein